MCDLGEVTLNCAKMAGKVEQMIHKSFRYDKINQI